MKQIAITAPYKIGLLNVPKPKPEPDQILTKTLVTGVSIGTELIDYRGAMEKLPKKWKKVHPYAFPQLPGYENVGEVVEVGKKVKDIEVGDRVVHCGYHLNTASSQDVKPCPSTKSYLMQFQTKMLH